MNKKIQEKTEEQRRIVKEVLLYTEELTEEMNLRLINAQCNEEYIIFVESIEITGLYCPRIKNKYIEFLKQIITKCRNIFIKFLDFKKY